MTEPSGSGSVAAASGVTQAARSGSQTERGAERPPDASPRILGTIVETHCVERSGLGPWAVKVDISGIPGTLPPAWYRWRGSSIPQCGSVVKVIPSDMSAAALAWSHTLREAFRESAARFAELGASLGLDPNGDMVVREPAPASYQFRIESKSRQAGVTVPKLTPSIGGGTRRHNAKCARCGGPAFESLGLPKCEATVCIAPDEVEPSTHDVFAQYPHRADRIGAEMGWTHVLAAREDDDAGRPRRAWATRSLAVDAWRKARR